MLPEQDLLKLYVMIRGWSSCLAIRQGSQFRGSDLEPLKPFGETSPHMVAVGTLARTSWGNQNQQDCQVGQRPLRRRAWAGSRGHRERPLEV